MRQYYWKVEKGATVWHQLSWSHYRLLIILETIDEINYYSMQAVTNFYSVRQLEIKIKNKEYERLDENTKLKLVNKEKFEIIDFVKNPIVIKKSNNHKILSEKILKLLILEDLESFMKEHGTGFSFIGSEYKIKIGNNYNYIDLLLFNIKYNCYVVVELKVTAPQKEHIGQIETYMNFIDKNVKLIYHDKTIGIIIVKK